jgi:uncharacterized membrane protein
MLLDIQTFFGHFHPLLVHLPIGFLMLAVLFELLSYTKKFQHLASSISFILLIGFIAAFTTSVTGYLLSLTGDYDYQRLSNHQLGGIFVTVVSGLLFVMTTGAFKKIFRLNRKLFSSLAIVLLILISYTGHQGGTLTHGSSYLSLEVLAQQKLEKPTRVEDALLYEQVIQPLLTKRCSQCHREDKRKGKLSMHSISGLMKGGKTGPAVVAGKLEESELYKRITLDPSNEKFMPADGKPPLTKGEAAIIKWWIVKGMATDRKKISELKNVGEIKQEVAIFLGLGEANVDGRLVKTSNKVNPEIPASLNMTLIDSLRSKGVNIRVMLHNPVMLDVTVPAGLGAKINSVKSTLVVVAKNVIWLNVSDNGLTEKDLDFLPMMTNLEKLRLEKNPLTDAIGNQLAGLHHLESVNLNETKITKKCLAQLSQMKNLKRVYHWRTLVE